MEEVEMFPVRVAVETVRAQHCLTCAHDGHVLIDTYAIVSGATVLSQLVDTVLSALGHPQLAVNARGLVQVNNWKALPFEQITDNPDDTVHLLFKDIAGHITLRILTKPLADSASSQCITDLKQRLLKTAVAKNPKILSSVDNQQVKDLISQIISGDDPALLNHDQINAINEWLETLDIGDERRSPVAQTRFNLLFEVPKLEKWFKSDPNPSRQKLLNFMSVLNGTSFRKNHPKITYHQICNWFANQRATTGRRPALSTTPQINPQTVLSNMPALLADFRPKFDFASLVESCQKNNLGELSMMSGDMSDNQIDGGSDSPTPADDEVHSNSDGAGEMFNLKQESTASSPDISMHMASSLASSSPKHLDMGMGGMNGMTASQAARSRLMFDPLTELPILEKWFEENPHPTWLQIDQYTQMLNSCPYRENYPHISQHNVKIWFKNRRAKCKRMQTGILDKFDKMPGSYEEIKYSTNGLFPLSGSL